MGSSTAQRSEEIDGTPAECRAAVLDFESYPDWQSAVQSVEIREQTDDEAIVAFEVDAKVRKVRYVLRYTWPSEDRIEWTYVEGDVKDISGGYDFEELPDGGTKATYTVALDPGIPLFGPVKKVLTDGVMRASVRELKAFVEGAGA